MALTLIRYSLPQPHSRNDYISQSQKYFHVISIFWYGNVKLNVYGNVPSSPNLKVYNIKGSLIQRTSNKIIHKRTLLKLAEHKTIIMQLLKNHITLCFLTHRDFLKLKCEYHGSIIHAKLKRIVIGSQEDQFHPCLIIYAFRKFQKR